MFRIQFVKSLILCLKVTNLSKRTNKQRFSHWYKKVHFLHKKDNWPEKYSRKYIACCEHMFLLQLMKNFIIEGAKKFIHCENTSWIKCSFKCLFQDILASLKSWELPTVKSEYNKKWKGCVLKCMCHDSFLIRFPKLKLICISFYFIAYTFCFFIDCSLFWEHQSSQIFEQYFFRWKILKWISNWPKGKHWDICDFIILIVIKELFDLFFQHCKWYQF
mgnify:CR=1 FL=1